MSIAHETIKPAERGTPFKKIGRDLSNHRSPASTERRTVARKPQRRVIPAQAGIQANNRQNFRLEWKMKLNACVRWNARSGFVRSFQSLDFRLRGNS